MIQLDYAYLCDYATVEGGKLTAVGASYTRIRSGVFPAMHLLSVAGRVRASADVESALLDIEIVAPSGVDKLRFGGIEIRADADAHIYEGRLGLLFAATTLVTLDEAGLYEVHLYLDGEHARRLAFEAVSQVATS